MGVEKRRSPARLLFAFGLVGLLAALPTTAPSATAGSAAAGSAGAGSAGRSAAAPAFAASNISAGGFTNTVAAAPANVGSVSNRLAVGGDVSGPFYSDQSGGQHWTSGKSGLDRVSYNNVLPDTRVASLAWSPDGSLYALVGAVAVDRRGRSHLIGGGFGRSADGGATWQMLYQADPSKYPATPQLYGRGGDLKRTTGQLMATDANGNWVFVGSQNGIWQYQTLTKCINPPCPPQIPTQLSITVNGTHDIKLDPISGLQYDYANRKLYFSIASGTDAGLWTVPDTGGAATKIVLPSSIKGHPTQLMAINEAGATWVYVVTPSGSGNQVARCQATCDPKFDKFVTGSLAPGCQYGAITGYWSAVQTAVRLFLGCTNYGAHRATAANYTHPVIAELIGDETAGPGSPSWHVSEIADPGVPGNVSGTIFGTGQTWWLAQAYPGAPANQPCATPNYPPCFVLGHDNYRVSETAVNFDAAGAANQLVVSGNSGVWESSDGGRRSGATDASIASDGRTITVATGSSFSLSAADENRVLAGGPIPFGDTIHVINSTTALLALPATPAAAFEVELEPTFLTWQPAVNGLSLSEDHQVVINPTNTNMAVDGDTDWSLFADVGSLPFTTGEAGQATPVPHSPTGYGAVYAVAYDANGDLFVSTSKRDDNTVDGAIYEYTSGTPVTGGPMTCGSGCFKLSTPVAGRPLSLMVGGGTRLFAAFAADTTGPGLYYRDGGSNTWVPAAGVPPGTFGGDPNSATSYVGSSVWRVSVVWLDPTCPASNPACPVAAYDPANTTTSLWLSTSSGVNWTPWLVQGIATTVPSSDIHTGYMVGDPTSTSGTQRAYLSVQGAAYQISGSASGGYTSTRITVTASSGACIGLGLPLPGPIAVDPTGAVYVTDLAAGAATPGGPPGTGCTALYSASPTDPTHLSVELDDSTYRNLVGLPFNLTVGNEPTYYIATDGNGVVTGR